MAANLVIEDLLMHGLLLLEKVRMYQTCMVRDRKVRYELRLDPRMIIHGSKLSKFPYLPCDMPLG